MTSHERGRRSTSSDSDLDNYQVLIYWHKLDKSVLHTRWFLLVSYVFRALYALFTFGICMWVRFDLDFREWVKALNWYTYWYVTYVITLASLCEVALSGLVIWAVLYRNRSGLKASVWCMIPLAIVEIVAASLIVLYGSEESETLTSDLYDVFIDFVYRWDTDPEAKATLKQIMEYVGCCGADGSDDFINNLKPVPFECRDPITGAEWGYGCMQQLAWYLEPWTAILASSAIFFAASDSLGVWAALKLRRKLKLQRDEQEEFL